jgi:hypothetical protein
MTGMTFAPDRLTELASVHAPGQAFAIAGPWQRFTG